MRARELMTADPACVTRDDSVQLAAQLMRDRDVGLIPVLRGSGSRELAGVLTDRDIAIRCVAAGRGADTLVGDIMSGDVRTVTSDDDVRTVMTLMGREQVRRIPVVDERGSVVGIVSQADIVLEAEDDLAAERTVERISQESETTVG